MALGDRIKEARTAAGLTQVQLAKAVGISQAQITRLETGLDKETSHLVKIALATRHSAYWLDSGRGRKKLTELEAVILNLPEGHQRQALAVIEALKASGGER